MTDTTRITVLGGVTISGAGGTPLSPRGFALLGYLVAHHGVPQPRAHLAEVLWPDSGSAQARTNLRRELHHLRTALGGAAPLGGVSSLVVDGTSLTWQDTADCEVDVRTFLTSRDRALAAAATGDRDTFRAATGRCFAEARGVFLPGCYDDWALAFREEILQSCLELCDCAVQFWERYDDSAAAVQAARQRVRLAPLEEPGHRQLIRLLRATGDRAGALRSYHACAALLEQELGVAPDPETRHELDALLAEAVDPPPPTSVAGAVGIRSAPPPTPVASAPPGPPELIGRDTERARLRQAWTGIGHGARFVVITGEPGAGKTRLVIDLVNEVNRRAGATATARCFAATDSLPLAPVAEWLRSPHLRLAATRLPPVWRAEVERLVPQPGSVDDPGAGLRAKVDAWQRLRFFEGLARAVAAVDHPLLLVIDDLQWCDKATLSWLSFLTEFARAAPLLIVATAREDELAGSRLPGPLRTMSTGGQVDTLALGPLPVPAVAELATAVLGRTLPEADLAVVRSVTGGNPYFVIEALRESRATGPGPVRPEDLRGVLDRRIARLSDPAREVAGLAAAIGRDVSLELLTEASDLEPGTVVHAVDELWHQRILEERGRGYDFSHDLLREAAYDALEPAHRWLLHRRLADSLERIYEGRTDEVAGQLAEQYDRSGQPDRALPFYRAAARRAGALFAHTEAVRLWERCLALVRDRPASRSRDEEELAILEQLLPPLNAWLGYAAEPLERYERRTAELGRRLELVRTQATASIALFATTFVQGHTAEAYRWGQLAALLSEQFPDLSGQAHLAVAGSALSLGLVPDSDRHFALACELSGSDDSLPIGTRTAVHARAWWAHAQLLLDDETRAAATAEQAVLLARQLDHPYTLAVALAYAAVTAQLCNDLSRLEQLLPELTTLCERYAFAYYPQWGRVLAGWLHGGPRGLRMAELGIENLRRDGALARSPYWLCLLADLHRRAGDQPAALAVLDAAASNAAAHDDVWWLPEVLRSRAALSEPAAARVHLDQAVALAESNGSENLARRSRAAMAELGG